ncbi:hypothetical protein JL100_014205 [Skermanella mucosa]|uniref:hypothetical protein n=1 Tax=Skermanella mucosa TaxID=1789672 RepID=UPI00192A7BE9|nr:hypothetical protein [Skermanella mucosa]UEM23840.1 hypothetical protein JL100_014205 [Skermanella mucosa]
MPERGFKPLDFDLVAVGVRHPLIVRFVQALGEASDLLAQAVDLRPQTVAFDGLSRLLGDGSRADRRGGTAGLGFTDSYGRLPYLRMLNTSTFRWVQTIPRGLPSSTSIGVGEADRRAGTMFDAAQTGTGTEGYGPWPFPWSEPIIGVFVGAGHPGCRAHPIARHN